MYHTSDFIKYLVSTSVVIHTHALVCTQNTYTYMVNSGYLHCLHPVKEISELIIQRVSFDIPHHLPLQFFTKFILHMCQCGRGVE